MTEGDRPLDRRKEAILHAIVEGYIRTGEPVGSKTVVEDFGLGVSPATVRNEMAILEREGYIAQPHTSAGRVPTDRGYRYYVDVLARPAAIDARRRAEIERSLLGTLTALDDLLARASRLLAELTDYTAFAAAPPPSEIRLRSVELVALGGPRVLLVAIFEGARHEERVLELGAEPAGEALRSAGERASRLAAGLGPLDAAMRLESQEGEGAELLAAVAEGLRALARDRARLFTGGTHRVLEWEPVPQARRLLEALEEGRVGPLLPGAVPDRVSVRIGREVPLRGVEDLSLIAAGYGVRGAEGALGVLGPTRMPYPTVMSTVAAVARYVSRALRRLHA